MGRQLRIWSPFQGRKIATEEFDGNQEKGRQEKEALTHAAHYLA
jgi:hypothetical protein